MNKKIFAALASATMALSATGSLAVFAEDFDVVTEADGTNGTVSGVTIPNSGVAVNEENFPDKDFRNALISYAKDPNGWDYDNFGYGDKITKAELEGVTTFHVPAGVKDLTGIEFFTNLKVIDNVVINVSLETNDDNGKEGQFTPVANGTQTIFTPDIPFAETMPAGYDVTRPTTTGLVTGDLSQNTKLTTIYLPGESKLETLDVPAGNALTSVTVSGTDAQYAPIHALDLSGNKLLKNVNISYTDISSLDLSDNHYLTDVAVAYNKLNTLDLTNNMVLSELDCSYNNLYSLDVPNTGRLTNLVAQSNELQEFDLTGLSGLVSLNLTDNELKSIDLAPVKNTLQFLGVAYNHLGYLNLKGITIESATTSPQVVFVDDAYDGVNLPESFAGIKTSDITLDPDTTAHINDDDVLVLGDNDTVKYTYATKNNRPTTAYGAIDVDVYVKKESVLNRLYNPNSGEHFYTKDIDEKNALVELGWKDEGIGWTSPSETTGNRPVYRLYNPNAGDHHYTMSSSERDILVSVGWKYENIGWYSYDAPQTYDGTPATDATENISSVAVLREYNPNAKAAGAHNYTVNHAENDFLVSVGWLDEGIAWYAMK